MPKVIWLSILCCALTISACGESDSNALGPDAVRTGDPERAFAPVVELGAGERWRPMSARWFLEHAKLWFVEDRGCPHRPVAVGRTLPELRNEDTDWIYPVALGKGDLAYYRNPFDVRCQRKWEYRSYADQLTRPHDDGPRPEELRPGQGFVLDLADSARPGPSSLGDTPVYSERRDEGDGAVRLTYWMLFGMNAPPERAATHEGDWERVDVLLRSDGDGRYEPQAVQLASDAGAPRDVPWGSVERDGRHPVVVSAPGSHTMTAPSAGERCGDCTQWRTWEALTDARRQLWHGFGGAWGEVGATSAKTGPLGPHGEWRPEAASTR